MKYSGTDQPIRVMMIVASLPPDKVGGAETQALRLGKELVNQNVSTWMVTPGKKNYNGNGKIDQLTVSRPYSFLSFLFEVMSILKKKTKEKQVQIEYDDKSEITNRIQTKVSWPTLLYMRIFYWNCILFIRKQIIAVDIIHAHTMEWSAIVAVKLGKKFGKPVLIKDSTMNGFESLARFPNGKQLQDEIRNYAYFIAMTHEIERNFEREGIKRNRFFRVPNGIKVQKRQIRTENEVEGKKVLFVGNLYQQPAKGIDILLKAWKMVVNELPSVNLILVGDGAFKVYEKYVEDLGIKDRVQFLGKRDDIDTLFSKACLFVLPSRREGMSNALLEAMLNGVPCIATNISGNQDIIVDGVNGLLVPPSDVAALSAAIVRLLRHPELSEAMGKEGRETILRNFDIAQVAKKYRMVYNQLLNRE